MKMSTIALIKKSETAKLNMIMLVDDFLSSSELIIVTMIIKLPLKKMLTLYKLNLSLRDE